MSDPTLERHTDAAGYWRANLRLLVVLLVVWAVVSLGISIVLVEPLNEWGRRTWGLPFGFWMAQQGAIYTFVLLILIYATVMNRLDDHYDVD